MSRNEYDANAGLKEGRRVNPGQYKLPPQTYMSLGDVVMLLGASIGAVAVIAYAQQIWEGLWKLWSVVTGGG
jgi:hypothetical protein